MLTWRDDDQRSEAFLGEWRVGIAWPYYKGAYWEVWLDDDEPLCGDCPTLDEAKAALTGAVEDWVRRAGLVVAPT